MTDHIIALLTLIVAILGVAIAGAGIFYAIKTLRAGVESTDLAVKEAKKNTEIAGAQFWVMIRGIFAHYDDVHAKLRPGGIWAPNEEESEILAKRGPTGAAEWSRVELYMGMFEYCETLIGRALLKEEDFRNAYRYRLGNLVRNAVIVDEKLYEHKADWQDFWSLCKRFDVKIPSRDAVVQARA
jgi:hypothetical protein